MRDGINQPFRYGYILFGYIARIINMTYNCDMGKKLYGKMKSLSKNILGKLVIIPTRWTIYFSFVLLNILISLNFQAPFSYPDEYGVISIGNWMFGGPNWAYKPTMYFGYTFSPFVGLMLQFFEGIRPIYVGSLIIKSFQISLIPFFCYKLLDEVLELKDVYIKAFLSIAVGLFPSFIVYSKYLGNETALHFTLFICFYLVGKCAARKENDKYFYLFSALLGFFVVFAYASHGIGLAYIATLFVLVPIVHFITKRSLVSYPFFLGAFISFILLDSKMKSILQETVYRARSSGQVSNTIENNLPRAINAVANPSMVINMFKLYISRFHYSISATHGLALLALIILLGFFIIYLKNWYFHRKRPLSDVKTEGENSRDNVLFVLILFSLFILIAGMSVSILVHSSIRQHGTTYFYGRYHEYFPIPMIVMGLYFIYANKINNKTLMKYVKIAGALYLSLTTFVQLVVIPHVMTSPLVKSTRINRFLHLISVLPFVGDDPVNQKLLSYNLISLGLVCVTTFIFMLYFFVGNKRRHLSMVILAVIFGYTSYYGVSNVVLRTSTSNYNNFYRHMEILVDAIKPYDELYEQYPNLYVITRKLGARTTNDSIKRSRAQLAFNKYSVHRTMRFDQLRSRHLRANAILISEEMHDFNASYQLIYESKNAYIWIRGEEIRAYYNNSVAEGETDVEVYEVAEDDALDIDVQEEDVKQDEDNEEAEDE